MSRAEDAGNEARLEGDRILLPGLSTAHSHAFQRALRGRTERRAGAAGSFWSWRGLMYELAAKLDPDTIYALSKAAYAELAMAGVTAVGEFHYVHHGPDGSPYEDRTVLAESVVRAAREVGLRVTLLRVLYHRGGVGVPAEGAQRRFSDPELDVALADVERLAARFRDDPLVRVGLAPHSVRAVPRHWLGEAARFARERGLPLHAHVAEQRREIEECLGEHGVRPVTLLAEEGVLGNRFVAVHATHLEPSEVKALGDARAFACLCRTTERDLGDGLADAASLLSAGVRLCTGVDSHAVSDPFEEARAVELDDRSRAEARHVAAEAPLLLRAASAEGYAAIGMDGLEREDRVVLRADDPSVAGATADALDDAVIFGATPRAVREVVVDGTPIVQEGMHPEWPRIREAFAVALVSLDL